MFRSTITNLPCKDVLKATKGVSRNSVAFSVLTSARALFFFTAFSLHCAAATFNTSQRTLYNIRMTTTFYWGVGDFMRGYDDLSVCLLRFYQPRRCHGVCSERSRDACDITTQRIANKSFIRTRWTAMASFVKTPRWPTSENHTTA